MQSTGSNENGYTLIEVMIATLLGLFVVSGFLSIFISSYSSYKLNSALSVIQENGRFAFVIMSDAIQQAGYVGCNSEDADNRINVIDINDSSAISDRARWAISGVTFKGYSAGSAWIKDDFGAVFTDALLKDNGTGVGDILAVVSGESDAMFVAYHDPDAQTVVLKGNHSTELKKGDVVILNDCRQVTMMQIDRINGTYYDSRKDVTRFRYDGLVTANCNRYNVDDLSELTDSGKVYLGGQLIADCGDYKARAKFANHVFIENTAVLKLSASAFHLRTDDAGLPTLYRTMAVSRAGKFSVLSEPLISGVENLRFIYGVRNNEGGDDEGGDGRQAVDYLTASEINDGKASWVDVKYVRIYLLLRSFVNKGEAKSNHNFSFPNIDAEMIDCSKLSADQSACPGFLYTNSEPDAPARQVIQNTIMLRNQMP